MPTTMQSHYTAWCPISALGWQMWDWFLHKDGSGATIDGAGYFYDNAGNRTAKGNMLNGTTEEYTYDAIYQLKQVTRDGAVSEDYTYDKVGNRLTSLDVASYSYNSSNQLTSADGTSFTYDKNGNTATKTDTNGQTTYAWDYENRLTSVTLPGGGGMVTFKYDPFGRRIQKSGLSATTIYAYDGANGVEELTAAGAVTARYVQGAGIDEPLAQSSTALNFYSADGLGSITSLTDSTGASAATFVYGAFGVLSSSTGTTTNSYRYTAQEYDPETGLYYYRARYYDQNIGRFISEDPIQFGGGGNFFAYTWNSATNLIDPSGLEPGWWTRLKERLFPPQASEIPPPPALPTPAPPAPPIPLRCQTSGECDFTPDMQQALECFQLCLGKRPTITCGRGQHPGTDPHSRGEGADFGHGPYSNPWLERDDAEACFNSCFPRTSWGSQEYNNSANTEYHYHFQYTPNRAGAGGFAPGIRPHGK